MLLVRNSRGLIKAKRDYYLFLLIKITYNEVGGVQHVIKVNGEWSNDEMIFILTQEEEIMKKGKPYNVYFVSHNGNNKKKKIFKVKGKKFQFKKKRNGNSEYCGHSSRQHSRESFDKSKHKFNGKYKICTCLGISNLKIGLRKRKEFKSKQKLNKGDMVIIVGDEASLEVKLIGVVSIKLSFGH
ncbi:hypothetical protein CR513_56754, partial [Mucuna pruriens]